MAPAPPAFAAQAPLQKVQDAKITPAESIPVAF